MVRLPTEWEVQELAEAGLEELWADLHSAEEAATVFGDLESIIQAPLSLWCRLGFAKGAVEYCSRINGALEANAIKKAERLVRSVRRDIAGLKRFRDQHEQRLLEGKVRLREAGRECLAAYESAKEGLEGLRRLAGYDDDLPRERLAEAATATWEACWKVQPPFRFADCEAALAILDGVLKGWGTTTHSSRGQNWESKALDELIARLEGVFEQATGTHAGDAPTRFVPFVTRALEVLPREFARYYRRSDGALRKRVRRSRSKRRNAAS